MLFVSKRICDKEWTRPSERRLEVVGWLKVRNNFSEKRILDSNLKTQFIGTTDQANTWLHKPVLIYRTDGA